MQRTGLLLVNLGTPDSTAVPDVRRYLREFLSDPRVIDLPGPARWLLLNLVILPFRPRVSAEAYEKIWGDAGSPLLVYGRALLDAVSERLGEQVPVALGMRYGRPSIDAALDELAAAGADRIVLLPLFPQDSSAAWGSAAARCYELAAARWKVPVLSCVAPFYDHPAFVRALGAVAGPALEPARADRVLMSFHGVPERHVRRGDPSGAHCLASEGCCDTIVPANRRCYRAQCFATARALAAALGLAPDTWEVTFQSRLGRTVWIGPYTDVRLRELAEQGVRRVAVLSPAFVADCLETIEELGIRGREDFLAHGGEELTLVPSLNAHPAWADAVVELFRETAGTAAAAS